MKKFLCSTVAAIATFLTMSAAQAQVFTVKYIDNSNDTIKTTGTTGNQEITPAIQLELAAGVDSFTYNWQFVELSFPNSWTLVGLCDNIICLPYSDTVAQYKTPYAVSSTSFPVYVTNNPINVRDDIHLQMMLPVASAAKGIGVFKFKVIAADVYGADTSLDQTTEVLFVVEKTNDVTSVKNIIVGENDVKVYPNPASAYTSMEFSAHLNVTKVEILDATGRFIKAINVNNSHVTISTLELMSGNYFINVLNNDGIKLTTKQLVKK